MLYNTYLMSRLILEAARATFYKRAVKARVLADFVQLYNDAGEPIFTIHRDGAPDYVLRDLRNAVRN